jgi:hypothetical protein
VRVQRDFIRHSRRVNGSSNEHACSLDRKNGPEFWKNSRKGARGEAKGRLWVCMKVDAIPRFIQTKGNCVIGKRGKRTLKLRIQRL